MTPFIPKSLIIAASRRDPVKRKLPVSLWAQFANHVEPQSKVELAMFGFAFGVLTGIGIMGLIIELATRAPQEWRPKIGDRVSTHYSGSNCVTVITNVVNVGRRSESGVIVFGDGLPGLDSFWVTPAP